MSKEKKWSIRYYPDGDHLPTALEYNGITAVNIEGSIRSQKMLPLLVKFLNTGDLGDYSKILQEVSKIQGGKP